MKEMIVASIKCTGNAADFKRVLNHSLGNRSPSPRDPVNDILPFGHLKNRMNVGYRRSADDAQFLPECGFFSWPEIGELAL
jgi:hypothetical protein